MESALKQYVAPALQRLPAPMRKWLEDDRNRRLVGLGVAAAIGICVVLTVARSQGDDAQASSVEASPHAPEVDVPVSQATAITAPAENPKSSQPPEDMSKQPPHKLIEALSDDTALTIAALRGLLAQSGIVALQNVSARLGVCSRLAALAADGPAAVRLLSIEVLANYAARTENHPGICDGGVLDSCLRNLLRALGRRVNEVDVALATASTRLLLNMSATDEGAVRVVRLELLRALLEHGADKRSPMRLSCLKVLRNVAVSELPADCASLLRSCVARSALATTWATAELRKAAAVGDEAASLTLSILDKTRGAAGTAAFPATPERPAARAQSTAAAGATPSRDGEDLPLSPPPNLLYSASRGAGAAATASHYASVAKILPSMARTDEEDGDEDDEDAFVQPVARALYSSLATGGRDSSPVAPPRHGHAHTASAGSVASSAGGSGTGSAASGSVPRRLLADTISSSAKVRKTLSSPSVEPSFDDGQWDVGTGAQRGTGASDAGSAASGSRRAGPSAAAGGMTPRQAAAALLRSAGGGR